MQQHIVQVHRLGRNRHHHPSTDVIEGRGVDPDRAEPELIRQKRGPAQTLSAANDTGKTEVRCRQIIRGGRPQTVPLTQAKTKFQSHERKCQCCGHRMDCATA